MFEIKYAIDFKEAAVKLQQRVEAGEFYKAGSWSCGICYMLAEGGSNHSYDIMGILLDRPYLGRPGEFTEDRQLFLEFLAYTLTVEDIYEICLDCWEN